jgi:ADP-ribose pyrophosphatase
MNELSFPEVIAKEEIYRGKVFDVTLETIREGERTYQREIVNHNGSAVIVPVFDDNTIALVKQYRHPARKYLYEVVAGTLNRNEDPIAGAARELEEELGHVAARIEKLCEFYISPGFLSEKMFVYLATGLRETEQQLEEDEVIEIIRVTFDEALQMIERGEIEDAKTITGILLTLRKLAL